VTEKVHGANFSFYVYQSGKVMCGKRTGIIEDNFFGHYSVVERLREQVYQLAAELFAQHCQNDTKSHKSDNDNYVIFFGELFGGQYPNVPSANPDMRPVQQGVWYSPQLEFMLFDICVPILCSSKVESVTYHFLPFADVISLSKKHNFLFAEPLFVGPLAAAASFPVQFQSTIPAKLRLPPLEVDNFAEGIVIRELNGPLVSCHDESRSIMKIKTTNFRDGEGCPIISSGQEYVESWLLSLIDDANLLASASSKVGRPECRENWEGIAGCMLDDMLDQCGESCPDVFYLMKDKLRFGIFNMLANIS